MKTKDQEFDRLNIKYITDYEKFYDIYNEREIDYSTLDSEDLNRLREESVILNKEVCAKLTVLEDDKFCSFGYKERIRLARIMGRLILNPKKYTVETKAEGMLLYIYCVDPNFLAVSLFNEYKNDIDQLKREIINQFGMYDDNIINIILNENKILRSIDPIDQKRIKLEANKELKKVLKK